MYGEALVSRLSGGELWEGVCFVRCVVFRRGLRGVLDGRFLWVFRGA